MILYLVFNGKHQGLFKNIAYTFLYFLVFLQTRILLRGNLRKKFFVKFLY